MLSTIISIILKIFTAYIFILRLVCKLPIFRIINQILYSFPASKELPLPPDDPKGRWSHAYLRSNGVKIHYVFAGQKGKPLMLMLHGFPEDWYSWRYLIPQFSKDYFVVAVDMPGFGLSEKPTNFNSYTLNAITEDVAGVIKNLQYLNCILVGHDWGAIISWSIVSMYPKLVKQLIILNTPHIKTMTNMDYEQMLRSWYTYFFQFPFLPELFLSYNKYSWIRSLYDDANPNNVTTEDINYIVNTFANRTQKTAVLNYYRNLYSIDLLRFFNGEKLLMPVLIIWGENDRFLKSYLLKGSEQIIDNLTINKVNASHWVHQDQPEQVVAHMKEFLAKYS